MVLVTAVKNGLLRTHTWYDPRFHFDVGIGDSRVPSESDEIRIESEDGCNLSFEFDVDSHMLTGFLCLTFFGRATRGKSVANDVTAEIADGCPILSVEQDKFELEYSRPASNRNVFTAKGDISVMIPSATIIQFLLGPNPTRLVRVSDTLRVGMTDSSALTFVELSGVPAEATTHFLAGNKR